MIQDVNNKIVEKYDLPEEKKKKTNLDSYSTNINAILVIILI